MSIRRRALGTIVSLVVVTGCGGSQAKASYARQGEAAAPAVSAESYASVPAEPAPPPMADGDDMAGEAKPQAKKVNMSAAPMGGNRAPAKGKSRPAPVKGSATSAGKAQAQPKRNLMLIYTANITLAVFEALEGLDAVEKLAAEHGGYLVRRTDRQIVVRVPAEKFQTALAAVSKIGDELRRDVSVQDVTAQFRDLDTRLKNLVAVRDRLQGLLAKAKNVTEALQVERELTRVTGEIERIKGRLKLYRELIAFSTIAVTFQAAPVEKIAGSVDLPFPWLRQLGLSNLLNL